MTKINENIDKFHWIYMVGIFITITLQIIVWPPYFFPADWGKTIIFRSIVSVLLFLFIFQVFFKKKDISVLSIKKNPVFFSLSAVFTVFLLATIFSVDLLFSLWGSPYRGGGFVTFAFCIIFAVLAFMLLNKEAWKKVWFFSISIGVLVSFIAITQYNSFLNKLFNIPFNALFHKIVPLVLDRPSSTMGNPDILALYFLLLSFITLSFGIKWQKLWEKIFCFSALAIFIITILITGSRAVYLGMAIGVIYFFWAYPKKIKIIKVATASIVVLTAIFVFYINTASQLPDFLQQNKLFKSTISRLSFENIVNDPRFASWPIELKMVEAKPIFGYGPENFSVGFDKYYDPSIPYLNRDIGWWDRAHNVIIQTGSDAGILGILAYLALFIVLFWQLGKLKKNLGQHAENTTISHGIQATLIGYFVALFFGFDSFSTYLIFFLLAGYSMFLIYGNKIEKLPDASKYKKVSWKPALLGILFIALVIFLWQYNFVPLQINAEINKAENLTNQKSCDKAFALMDKTLLKHSFLDSYVRMEYIDFKKTCTDSFSNQTLSDVVKNLNVLSEGAKTQPLYTRYWIFMGNFENLLAGQEKNVATKKEHLEKANNYFNKALQLAPKHQEILIGQVKMEIIAGNYDSAKNYAEKCITLNPALGDCYFYLGISEIYLRDMNIAKENIQTAFNKAYNINAEVSLSELKNAYAFTNDFKNLVIIYEQLIALNPNNFQYHSSLAACYKELAMYSKAREEAMIVLKLSPESKPNVDAFLSTLPY